MSHLDEGVIHALLDGEIPSTELPPIQAHLGSCAECRARLAEEQELLATSDRLIELIEVPAAVTPVAPAPSRTVRGTWARNLAWAATVVLAAGLGYSARGPRPPGPAPEVPVPETLYVRSPVPETLYVRSPEPVAPAERASAPAPLDQPQNAAPARRDRSARESKALADSAPALPAPLAAQSRAARRLGAEPMRLEEISVASPDAGTANPAAPISLTEAVRKLGGSLRLIEGLIPERLEALGPAVRVVYLTGYGELVLSQQQRDGTVRHTLIAPRGFPPDSLEKLRARVRE